MRADLQKSQAVASRFLALAEQRADTLLVMMAHWLIGQNLAHVGEQVTALQHIEQAYALYDPRQHPTHVTLFGFDVGVFALAYMSHTLWELGYPVQAVERSRQALALAQEMHHPFSMALAQAYTAMLHQFRQEPQAAGAHAETALALCTEHGFTYYMAWATIIQGWVLAAQGQPQQGIARMQQGLATLQATGGRLRLPYYLTLLAEAYASSAEPATGVRLLAEAFAGMQHTAERRWEAELCRLQGTVLLAHASAEPPTAEAYFHQALDVARRQQAKSWELRAATSLARLWQSQDKRAEARALLAPIYGWFTEGFDTADLQEARVLLEALES